MEFNLEEFVKAPTLEVFHKCTKDVLLLLAEQYQIAVTKQAKKAVIKAELLSAFVQSGIFPAAALPKSPRSPSSAAPDDAVRLKELEVEMARLALREKELYLEQKKLETQKEIRLRELELEICSREPKPAEFDVSKNIRLVPQFNEKDVDKYFIMFERVAEALKWPKEVWTLLLQCALIGKAQEAYASLSAAESLDFDKVKCAILRAYELVPEAYRQKFRNLTKREGQTYVEFIREKEILFNRWCSSQNANDFAHLKQLILIEEFKNNLPRNVATYLNENKVSDVSQAAVLVDEYVLTHKSVFSDDCDRVCKQGRSGGRGQAGVSDQGNSPYYGKRLGWWWSCGIPGRNSLSIAQRSRRTKREPACGIAEDVGGRSKAQTG
ncbi:hypothetical protein WMY93_030438 [Mugilogobius chulae]|uniref:SCAN box domain-containing protein n=1 Tax=Mugilogobius chulae TaxID=88201 RepID=A0AAW0MEH3_9GOBI